ncbi:acetate--CoA ligase family protein [Amycolatopsis sp. FDAARGOS 1241]|uniref:acetate--CoA ligase family protein n=1 Tax=Amycolatopsis sp. FDAARGOS 1241 TaxID=2778070 RepID=UPI00194F0593|nr:acetate--CoA ligase [Amycolatopsis sp. FDAARGOS 1241]QRP50208.1 acetate--CoA ligase family protein [Amycolatopsis sp. FDAARGOS 1241]
MPVDSANHWAQRLLHPRSVAIVGASTRPGSISTQALANLRDFGYAGRVLPVNAKYTELDGLPCYPSLDATPGPVDLALILVPAAAVPGAIDDCVRAGVGTAVVFSSGFGELGAEGLDVQQRLAGAARAGSVRLLGPNCQGLIYRPASLVATFSEAAQAGLGESSGIAYAGQSGAIGGSFLGLARERGIGLTAWASSGNQADLGVADLAAGFLEEDEVRVVAMYLEAIPSGTQWRQLTARARELGKNLVVLRSGRSAAGRRAAASHTGAMIGPDTAFELVSAEHGVIGVTDLDQLLDTVVELAARKPVRGPAVTVVTSSGGAGGIAADWLEEAGLRTGELAADTRRELERFIPAYGSTSNPVDVTAQLFSQDDDSVFDVCRTILGDPGTDVLMVIMTNVTGARAARVARQLVAAAEGAPKPLGVVWLADGNQIAEATKILREHHVPLHDSIGRKAHVLARLYRAGAARPPARTEPVAGTVDGFSGTGVVTESAGAPLLDALGVPRPEGVLVTSPQEAAEAAARLGGRVVLKAQSAGLTHKSEAGGVRVGVTDAASAYREMVAAVRAARPDVVLDGILVQSLVPPGIELLVGVEGAADGYPPVVTVGFGGVTAEIDQDVVTGLAPLSELDVRVLLTRLRGAPLLRGYRGRPGADVAAVAAAVAALSRYAAGLGDRLAELEINPLIAHPDGVSAADLVLRFTE